MSGNICLILMLVLCTASMVFSGLSKHKQESLNRTSIKSVIDEKYCLEKEAQAKRMGMINFDSRYYLFSKVMKPWHQARNTCKKLGSNSEFDLVSIETAHENELILNHINSKHSEQAFWTGGTDSIMENTWIWTNGHQFNFTDWASGEPSSYLGNEDCMTIWSISSVPHWHDAHCALSLRYICEMDTPIECDKYLREDSELLSTSNATKVNNLTIVLFSFIIFLGTRIV